jgi:hypothetical protein
MSRRLFALLIIAGASIPVAVTLLLRRAESHAADPVDGSSAFLVEARTGMSHGRPIWICTYAYGRQNFERTVFVSEASCPRSAAPH